MASGKTSKAVRNARASVVVKKPTPWGTIAAVVAIVLFGGAVFGYVYVKWDAKQELEEALSAYTQSESNQDPSDSALVAAPSIRMQTHWNSIGTTCCRRNVVHTF